MTEHNGGGSSQVGSGAEAPGDSFPQQWARTQRLTLGEPRTITVSPDGTRVVFLRSSAGDDPVNCLWVLDVETGRERLVADPRQLLDDDANDDLPAEERARRERAREGAGGVVAYATDAAVTVAAFALAGRLFVAGLISGTARELSVRGPVFDPRPDPTARHLAYVCGRELVLAQLDGSTASLAADDDPDVTWGSAEFIAAEEMGRQRGYWWSPDGDALAVCRVDTSPVTRWFISDPARPEVTPTEVAYPAAGTDNALVSLHIVRLDGTTTQVEWNRQSLPYLVAVRWTSPHGLLMVVQARDQRIAITYSVDALTGQLTERYRDHDDRWVEVVGGVPAQLADGRLVTCADVDGARRLIVGETPVTPADQQVRSVVSAGGESVVYTANPVDDATVLHVWRWTPDGSTALTDEPGVHAAWVGGDCTVVRHSGPDTARASVTVFSPRRSCEIETYAETSLSQPNVRILRIGERRLATAVLLPHDVAEGDRLPVLLDPYGGPHAQRVLNSRAAFAASQWFADQGFAVVVCDGRGTPGRGTEWERSVHRDLANRVLEDQIEALHGAAASVAQLDLSRVGIRGWSFGGYLAALAVLQRPDVFHAAVAGAPVTEWRWYDTHYTERYLGDPNSAADVYDENSLVVGVTSGRYRLTRPLQLIHGLADDNVVAKHTLQLSAALLAKGFAHEVLPLSGVTHMTPQPVIAERLLQHQLEFLTRSLAAPTPPLPS